MSVIKLKRLIREEVRRALKESASDLGLQHLDAMQDAGVFDSNAPFVTVDYAKGVAKYNNLDQLKVAIGKMPAMGLESAEDDLTQSDVNKARQLFQQVKSKLDGTKNYQLVARISPKDDLEKELYIWTIAK